MSRQLPLQQRECPADILLLIFEEVYCTAPATLRDLRLASRKFNVLVDPIVYRHLKLNHLLVKCFKVDDAPNVSPQVVVDARRRVRSAICLFTRQITINEASDRALDWASVVNLLLSLKKFNHLYWSWRKEGLECHNRPSRIPPGVLISLAERWPSAQISVDSLSSTYGLDDFSYLRPTRLVSLRLEGVRRRRFYNQTLKETLLACDQLKALHLLDVQTGSQFKDKEIYQSERLPAVEELFLQGYNWLHSPNIATSFWNWSRLTSLRLERVSIINFLDSVSPENLLQLRSLITDGYCQSAVDHTRVSVPPVMYL